MAAEAGDGPTLVAEDWALKRRRSCSADEFDRSRSLRAVRAVRPRERYCSSGRGSVVRCDLSRASSARGGRGFHQSRGRSRGRCWRSQPQPFWTRSEASPPATRARSCAGEKDEDDGAAAGRGRRWINRAPIAAASSSPRVSRGRATSRSRSASPPGTLGGSTARSRGPNVEDSRRRRPRALLFMGLPGAGKTTVKRRRLRPQDVDIEPDQFKRRHPRYSEEMGDQTDDEVHRWSVRRSVDAFEDEVNSARKPDIVLDSSGSNVEWVKCRIDAARRRGYIVELLWVDVPVEIALFRNRDRAARRGRGNIMVPDRVIIDKSTVMRSSFEKLRREVDSAEQLQNWSERSNELQQAKEDLYLYPPPRTRPPSLRPGDKGYGEPPHGACSPSPSRGSRRTMFIGPWKRGDDVMRKKNKRLEWMDRTFKGNRERYVLDHVLQGRDVLLEPNRYPYQLPPDVTHWTIWALKSMSHNELCEYIERWLDAREPHNVMSWNYDDNGGTRTIDIWHVHIYFRGRDGKLPFDKLAASDDKKRVALSNSRNASHDNKRFALSNSRHRSAPCSV